MHNISHSWLSVTTRHCYTPLYGLGIQKHPVEQYISLYGGSPTDFFGFCGYLVWKWEDAYNGTCLRWKLARGCRAILLFKNVTAFSLYLQLALWSYFPGPPLVIWWMLWSKPTVAFLTWVVLLGMKSPAMVGVNAALNLLSYTVTIESHTLTRVHMTTLMNARIHIKTFKYVFMCMCRY